MKVSSLIVLAFCLSTHAHADTYTYECKVGGKTLSLVADDTNNVILWRGKTYKILRTVQGDDDCAKFGWHAEYQGHALDFCIATRGVADFTEDGKDVQCQQTEMNGERLSQ